MASKRQTKNRPAAEISSDEDDNQNEDQLILGTGGNDFDAIGSGTNTNN